MIHITVVVANRYTFDTEVVTGKQIKEKANIPAGFPLHRRMRGGNEPIHDEERPGRRGWRGFVFGTGWSTRPADLFNPR